MRAVSAFLTTCSVCVCAGIQGLTASVPVTPSTERASAVAVAGAAATMQAPGSTRLLGGFDAGWKAGWVTEHLGGGETIYRVVSDAGGLVLRADSEGAATALLRTLDDGQQVTRISWRWKVARSLAGGGDETRREGDDYAARLFVVFGSGGLSRHTRALCYVWAGDKAVGSGYRSPYVDSVHTIVVQSGDERAGVWVAESRDFAADYLRAFGEAPDAVGAVALMVDTDDSGSRATAWYDDILISR